MAIHLQEEMNSLKRLVLAQSSLVEGSVLKSVQALERGNTALASDVIQIDQLVNRREVELEEECLKILALHQPVATDLRFIVSVIKINSDLERIADVAVNISKRTLALDDLNSNEAPFDCTLMVSRVLAMFKNALDSLVTLDADAARKVIDEDDEIDIMHRQTYTHVKDQIRSNPHCLEEMLLWLAVSRHLERIADLAAHIAEDVVYMIDGTIVRHNTNS